MKKIISLTLAFILIFSLGTSLISCEDHVCEFGDEWASNETHHWHECKGDNCLETEGKAEHIWDEGTINEETATDTEAEKTYKCTVCNATKGEVVQFEGAVEEEEWEIAVSEHKFDNVTIHYVFATDLHGTQSHIVKITEDKVYRAILGPGDEVDDFIFEGEEAELQREMFLAIFLSLLAEKENFIYDRDEKVYIMPDEVKTTVHPDLEDENTYIIETMRDGRVTFDEQGNVISFNFWISEAIYEGEELVDDTTGTISLSFSDYGSTVVE